MKKVLVYGLIMASVVGTTVMASSVDYSGDESAYNIAKENSNGIIEVYNQEVDKTEELNENDRFEKFVTVAQGSALCLNLDTSNVIIKTHNKDNIKIENSISKDYINIDNSTGDTVITNNILNANELSNKDVIITLPESVDFDIIVDSKESKVDLKAKKLQDLIIYGSNYDVSVQADEIKLVYLTGGAGNININSKLINGNITGNTGIGSMVLEIGNKDEFNKRGYLISNNEITKIDENQSNKFISNIDGDISKVFYK